MYNRYIPQPDGTYRRNRMQDPGKPSQPAPEPRREVPTPPPALEPEVHPCSGCIHRTNIRKPPQSCLPKAATSVSDFLKQPYKCRLFIFSSSGRYTPIPSFRSKHTECFGKIPPDVLSSVFGAACHTSSHSAHFFQCYTTSLFQCLKFAVKTCFC